MSETSFDRAISEHLALCERNRRLERRMPLDDYRENGESGTPAEGESAPATAASQEHWLDESSWDKTGERPLPEFDWGDD